MIMKFYYEFEFDVNSFAEWVEEEYFNCDYDIEERNRTRLLNMLYNYVEDTDSIPLSIIREDIDDYNGKKYASKIIDKACEILEEKKIKLKEEEEKEEIMEHLRFIRDYCEKQCDCFDCPIKEFCESDTGIGSWRIK